MSLPGKLFVSRVFRHGFVEITPSLGFDPFSVLRHLDLNPVMFDLVYLGNTSDGPAKDRILGISKEDILKHFGMEHEISFFTVTRSEFFERLLRGA